jgi:hypothetical protein
MAELSMDARPDKEMLRHRCGRKGRMDMTTAADAIRARRRLTNKIIAAHEAARLRPFLHPEVKLIAGDGTLIAGVDDVLAAFHAQFQDPGFIAYVRTTQSVTLDQDGARAAEAGSWVGSWRAGGEQPGSSGTYLAVWRKSVGQWVIESELYVTLQTGASPSSD